MSNVFLFALRLLAVLGCGLMAGLFFAFSTAVIGGLAKLGPAQGILAMQSINRVILNPLFLTVFMGTAALCALALLTSFGGWSSSSALFLAGSALYVVGAFLVTVIFNIPLNSVLDAALPNSPEGSELWTRYLTTWTAWNHVRTVSSLLATALLTLGFWLETLSF